MKTLATMILAGVLAVGAAPKNYTGVITDTMCGANHAHMGVKPDEKCVRECVKQGYKYALLVGKDMYVLSDQQTPEKFAGRKVNVTGTLYEKTRIIKVENIQPAK
ncbi:MAG: hypothetical protein ACE15B_09810 [Bryobacteraceae bacterium]